jgi:hypothetical protein
MLAIGFPPIALVFAIAAFATFAISVAISALAIRLMRIGVVTRIGAFARMGGIAVRKMSAMAMHPLRFFVFFLLK